MSDNKSTVITAYGHDKIIDKIVVCSFTETSDYWRREKNAKVYCNTINSLVLKEGTWAVARQVTENVPWVIREMDLRVLAKALKGESPEVVDKVLSNMSHTSQKEFKGYMEVCKKISKNEVIDAQEEILEFIGRSFTFSGEELIKFPRAQAKV